MIEAAERKMSASESEYIGSLLKFMPTQRKRFLKASLNVLIFWIFSMLACALVWFVLTWILGQFASLEIGLSSPYAVWIQLTAVSGCLLSALYSTSRWLTNWANPGPALLKDIAAGVVVDEVYLVKDLKCFKEPEFGGLIYFLCMSDNNVLVLYDYESQAAETSTFVVKSCLQISRTLSTEYFITQTFSGDKVALSGTFDLTIAPQQWPEPDSWCAIAWHELEEKLSAA